MMKFSVLPLTCFIYLVARHFSLLIQILDLCCVCIDLSICWFHWPFLLNALPHILMVEKGRSWSSLISWFCYNGYITFIIIYYDGAPSFVYIQCGVVTTRSVFTKPGRAMGCFVWVQTLGHVLPRSLKWCMHYRVILHRVITACHCIPSVW